MAILAVLLFIVFFYFSPLNCNLKPSAEIDDSIKAFSQFMFQEMRMFKTLLRYYGTDSLSNSTFMEYMEEFNNQREIDLAKKIRKMMVVVEN